MKTRKQKVLVVLLILAAVLTLFAGCSGKNEETVANESAGKIGSMADLSGKKISVISASSFVTMINERPDIVNPEIMEFNTNTDAMYAVLNGKSDAAITDMPIAELFCSNYPDAVILEDYLADDCYGYAFAKGDPLCDEFSTVIKKLTDDGTLDDMKTKWCGSDYAAKVLPDQTWPGTKGTLQVWCSASLEPMCYVGDGGQITGFDIDVLLAIAKELDYHMEFTECDSNGRIAGIVSGKANVTCGSMSITEERKQSVDFSETYYVGAAVAIIRKSDMAAKTSFTRLSDLNGRKLASVSGSLFKEVIDASSKIESYSEYSYYTNSADGVMAVASGKIDGYIIDLPQAMSIVNEITDVKILEEVINKDQYGYALAKGSPLTEKFNEALAQMKVDGTMITLQAKWFGTDDSIKHAMTQDWAAPNGEITYWIADEGVPMCYVRDNNESAGLELDILLEVAKRLGYRVNYKSVAFGGLLAAVSSGKADVVSGMMSISDERKQSVDMTDSCFDGAAVVIVRKTESETATAASETTDTGFIDSIKASFVKTFVTETRWKLFLEGLGNTMLITILSAIFGTVIGFAVFMVCRKGNRIANKAADILAWLIQGMPTVVLLMVLFYIVFGKSNISGTYIAILGFTITFGNSMYGMLKTGVGALDKGQEEAALALGYTSNHAFFRIILPQAAKIFLPSYKAELVSLAKATSIVGYIAVQDLTKMSDIIRSRTFEPFFPLIVTAIIYYLFGALLTYIISNVQINIDPEHRKEESILKGVKV